MKTAKPTESPEVIEAQQRVEYLNSLVEDLNLKIQLRKKELEELRALHCQAEVELKNARIKADEHLPQATLWESSRFGRDSEIGKVVILRRTPSGQVVCRFAGSSNNKEMRFKPPKREWDNKFYAAEKQDCIGRSRYLLDVPQEYIKAARKQNT